jgi:hypothetical protein
MLRAALARVIDTSDADAMPEKRLHRRLTEALIELEPADARKSYDSYAIVDAETVAIPVTAEELKDEITP